MVAVTAFRRVLLPFACGLLVACGGPEGVDDGSDFATAEEGLVGTASSGTGTGATGSPGGETTLPAPGSTTVSSRVSVGSPFAAVAYLVNGDSSPDPIPARSSNDDTRKSAGAACDDAYPPGWWRDACHQEVDDDP